MSISGPQFTFVGGAVVTFQPFADGAIIVPWTDSDGAFIIERTAAEPGDQATFRIAAYSSPGDQQWQREYEYRPLPLNRDEALEREVQRFVERHTDFPVQVLERLPDAVYVPAFLPPIERAVAGSRGSVWVRWWLNGRSEAIWQEIDSRGIPRRTVRLGGTLDVRYMADDYVLGLEADDHGVLYLARYGLMPAGQGANR